MIFNDIKDQDDQDDITIFGISSKGSRVPNEENGGKQRRMVAPTRHTL